MELKAYLAEDNAILRENLVGALEEMTCVNVVGTGSTEVESLAWLAGNPLGWDILVVDLFLSPGSGLRLVEKIQRARVGQKIIVFSNYATAAVRMTCARLGVDAVFDKSTEIDSLVDYCSRQCFEQTAAA
ncbi:MAG: response regulator [Bdellovibrionales bacterium]|nr:response regulator [Ramlibacter sp.]